MKLCTIDGCERTHMAKGLCAKHYKNARRKTHGRIERQVVVACAGCGTSVKKTPDARYRQVCSYRCRYFITNGKWPEDGKALVGPIPREPRVVTPDVAHLASSRVRFISATCKWCGDPFIQDRKITGMRMEFCTSRCAKRHHKSKRERSRGRFDISPRDRIAIYERDNWTCQLCNDPVDQSLPTHHRWAATLDHIECQSWTLIPDHSPSNLRLAHRMCNSIRSDEGWSAA